MNPAQFNHIQQRLAQLQKAFEDLKVRVEVLESRPAASKYGDDWKKGLPGSEHVDQPLKRRGWPKGKPRGPRANVQQ